MLWIVDVGQLTLTIEGFIMAVRGRICTMGLVSVDVDISVRRPGATGSKEGEIPSRERRTR